MEVKRVKVEELRIHAKYPEYYDIPTYEQVEIRAKFLLVDQLDYLPTVHVSSENEILSGVMTWMMYRQMGLEFIEVCELEKEQEYSYLLKHEFYDLRMANKDRIKIAYQLDALCNFYGIVQGHKSRGNGGYTMKDVARMFNFSVSTLQRIRKLVHLHEGFHAMVKSKKIEMSVVIEICKHSLEKQELLWNEICGLESNITNIKQKELSIIVKKFLGQSNEDIINSIDIRRASLRVSFSTELDSNQLAEVLLIPELSDDAKQELHNITVDDLMQATWMLSSKIEKISRPEYEAILDQRTVNTLKEIIELLNSLKK